MFNELARSIHADNIAAGWWKQERHWNAQLGDEVVTTVPRNIGELLCLVHSEIDEGFEGFFGNLMDDKLPHLTMFSVEMADTCIRVFDILGYKCADIDAVMGDIPMKPPEEIFDPMNLFAGLHCAVSHAMEGYRKSNDNTGNRALVALLMMIIHYCDHYKIGLFDVIGEKRAFNAIRPDHKLEAREAADGKKF